ncbi:diguanylate cyclase (GGDEF) domain-containing protein [Stigmatella aurantiaca]|uniref:Diguanylate cyclase (GGDEF) domain-containing protein n=1 Tax=Stigmatella aurantiaca TaxID=41 RepID=A0A1H7S4F5_STIAU|nr:diguanylate cyclase [Stigmatella aurantiaca]SEL67248.1 diguanylate cyclase (GGDEF) domain-containing protein [Stigmatella aurantiaca]
MRSALIAEPSLPVSTALRKFLESADYEVSIVSTLDEALRDVHARSPSVLLASQSASLDGEALCRQVKAEVPELPVLLLYLPEEEHPEPRAAGAGADAFLVGPLKRTTVVTCVGLLLQLFQARAAAQAVPAAEAEAPNRRSDTAGSPDFEFLKRLLLMEVKRSRRYRYPIALVLLELDRLAEHLAPLSPPRRTAVLAEVLALLTEAMRDIDVTVPLTEGRFVSFMPHTAKDGAMMVAERLRQRVKTLAPLPELTLSLGLAVFEPASARGQTQVSFGNLMRDASEALRKAQAAGGDRVVFSERGPQPPGEAPQEG